MFDNKPDAASSQSNNQSSSNLSNVAETVSQINPNDPSRAQNPTSISDGRGGRINLNEDPPKKKVNK